MTETETATFADFYPQDHAQRVTYAPDRSPVAYIEDDGRYSVDGMAGVAFYLVGRSQRWEPERYWIEDPGGDMPDSGDAFPGYWIEDGGDWADDREGQLWACMVGDDRLHPVEPEDLTELADDDYCGGCGQIGCSHDGR